MEDLKKSYYFRGGVVGGLEVEETGREGVGGGLGCGTAGGGFGGGRLTGFRAGLVVGGGRSQGLRRGCGLARPRALRHTLAFAFLVGEHAPESGKDENNDDVYYFLRK